MTEILSCLLKSPSKGKCREVFFQRHNRIAQVGFVVSNIFAVNHGAFNHSATLPTGDVVETTNVETKTKEFYKNMDHFQ